MDTQQSSPAADNPEVKLQSVTFIKTQDDNLAAVYQAKVGDILVPDEPVLELTATLASPARDPKAEQEIMDFLNAVRAGFAVTAPEPGDAQSSDQNPDASIVGNDVLFDAELVRPDPSKVTVGVIVVIQTTVEGFTGPERVSIALANGVLRASAWIVRRRVQSSNVIFVNDSVLKGICHHFTARTGRSMKATVTSNSGSATVSPGNNKINQGDSVIKTATRVTVCGASKKCCYTIREQF